MLKGVSSASLEAINFADYLRRGFVQKFLKGFEWSLSPARTRVICSLQPRNSKYDVTSKVGTVARHKLRVRVSEICPFLNQQGRGHDKTGSACATCIPPNGLKGLCLRMPELSANAGSAGSLSPSLVITLLDKSLGLQMSTVQRP